MSPQAVVEHVAPPGPAASGDVGINTGFVVLLASAGGLGGLMFGFDVAIITGAGPFIERRFGLDHLQLGFAFSSLLFGCVVGAAFAGDLADRFGRRRLMLAVAVLFAVTTVLTGLAETFAEFNVARFLGGLSVGAISLAAPMYVSEVAPPTLRGRMGALYQLAIVLGILTSYAINYAMRDLGPDAWRYMFMTGVAPAVIFFALMTIAPETPRYLAQRGRWEEAYAVLARIVGSAEAERELSEIRSSMVSTPFRLSDLAHRSVARPLAISCGLAVLVHLEGQNTVIDYAPRIFQSAGFSLDAALLSTFAVGLVLFVFTLISFKVIDRVGRRPLYVFGSLGMAASLFALVTASLTGNFVGATALALILMYLMFFSACIGPVFWTLLPEMFPNHVRSRALIIPVLVQWIVNAVVVLVFPAVFAALGQAGTFAILGLFCLLQALFAWRLVPETKNRTLEEIAAQW